MNVTVHGLSPSSFYLFRVYSVSELNQQEQDKNKWNYDEDGEGWRRLKRITNDLFEKLRLNFLTSKDREVAPLN